MALDNLKQDTLKLTEPQCRFSKIKRNETSKGQLKMDNTHNLPKEEGDDQEQAIMKTIGLMEPPEDKLFIAHMDETEQTGNGQTKIDDIWINAKTNIAMKLAIEENMKKQELPVKQQVPSEYHKFLNIFNKNRVNRFPDKRPWDHKIKMKEG